MRRHFGADLLRTLVMACYACTPYAKLCVAEKMAASGVVLERKSMSSVQVAGDASYLAAASAQNFPVAESQYHIHSCIVKQLVRPRAETRLETWRTNWQYDRTW